MKNSRTISKILTDTAWSTVSTVFLVAAGVSINILVGNFFGEKGLGLYSLVTTLYIAAGTIASFGLPGTLTKFTTQYADQAAEERRYASAAIFLAGLFGMAAGLALFAFKSPIGHVFSASRLSELLTAVSFSLPFFVVNKILIARLRGHQRIKLMAFAESLRLALIILLTVSIVFWKGSLAGAVWALCAAEIVLLFFLAAVDPAHRKFDAAALGRHCGILVRFGRQIILSRFFVEMNARFGILIVGIMLTPREVGIFTVAYMFAEGLSVLPSAFQKVTGPVITRLYLSGEKKQLEMFINYSLQATSLLLSSLAIAVLCLFPELVRIIYPENPGFSAAFPAVVILTTGMIFRGTTGSVGSVFVSIGHPEVVLKASPFFLLTNVAVSIALAVPLGVEGIACGTAASAILVFILWTLLMPRYLSIAIEYRQLLSIPAAGGVALALCYFLGTLVPLAVSVLIVCPAYVLLVLRVRPIGKVLHRLVFCKPNEGEMLRSDP